MECTQATYLEGSAIVLFVTQHTSLPSLLDVSDRGKLSWQSDKQPLREEERWREEEKRENPETIFDDDSP